MNMNGSGGEIRSIQLWNLEESGRWYRTSSAFAMRVHYAIFFSMSMYQEDIWSDFS
ncbi:hypothetical protein K7I13_11225 [Brucepastera parasyntrophica]|uniref:hypothetical protein n=1 Tax=Brucepastera parasyntrophica TaxID=2880008 RepID=UPI00210B7A0C|nr:hypothetical protein [Brucepastera parasyntrophica]ULQ59075.1 hypothetical protein K7I13_11225 [Brucepastera parasyntrophica]